MKQQGSTPNVRLERSQMTYTFSCPAPCNRVIRVDAHDDEDAVGKIIQAGAMTCRNSGSHDPCDTTHSRHDPVAGEAVEGSREIEHAGGRSRGDGIEGLSAGAGACGSGFR